MPIKLPPFTIHRKLHQLAERIDWGKRNLGVPAIWDTFAGQSVRWAVLDTGVDYDHPDLAEAVVAHKDFTGDKKYGSLDRAGHGSHCAGIIGARANSLGVVGVAPACELICGKVLDNEGSGYGEWIEAGVKWAIDQGADGISMSLGSSVPDPALERCVKLCNQKGVWIVCAAGNDGRNGVDWPGAYSGSIAVAATDEKGDVASFSSRGPEVDVAAPGVEIDSCWYDGGYATISGTSMATPFASGVGILAISKHRKAGSQIPVTTVEQLRQHLRNTCVDLGATGHDSDTGWGLVDPKTFVGLNPPPKPAPPPLPEPPPKPKRWCGSKVKHAALAAVRSLQGR